MQRRPFLPLALVLSLAGCSGSSSTETPAAEPHHETDESAAQQQGFSVPPSHANAAPTAASAPTPSTPAQPEAQAERVPFDPAKPSVAGVTWSAPASFAYRAPTSEMRLAEYVVGRAGDEEVILTVFHFPGMGGSIDSNIVRWVEQFKQPDGSSTLAATDVSSSTVNGIRVTTVTTTGHFDSSSIGGSTGQDQRLLGAIVSPATGPIFFKIVGPRAVVDQAEPAFRALVASFAPASN